MILLFSLHVTYFLGSQIPSSGQYENMHVTFFQASEGNINRDANSIAFASLASMFAAISISPQHL